MRAPRHGASAIVMFIGGERKDVWKRTEVTHACVIDSARRFSPSSSTFSFEL